MNNSTAPPKRLERKNEKTIPCFLGTQLPSNKYAKRSITSKYVKVEITTNTIFLNFEISSLFLINANPKSKPGTKSNVDPNSLIPNDIIPNRNIANPEIMLGFSSFIELLRLRFVWY